MFGVFVVLLVVASSILTGCANTSPRNDPNPLVRWDPIEPVNRHIYRMNARFDRWVLLPVAHVYDYIPQIGRTGVANFFSNFNELTTLANSILQVSPQKTGWTTGRLVVNSTLGVAGLFDWATRWGMPDYDEDLGQTFGHWGAGPGPYVVLPLLGPSSLRDGLGFAGDRAAIWAAEAAILGDLSYVLTGLFPVEVVSTRSTLDFRYGELGPFEYDLMRYMYLEYRAAQVAE